MLGHGGKDGWKFLVLENDNPGRSLSGLWGRVVAGNIWIPILLSSYHDLFVSLLL